jgi:hypothetical protein
MARTTGRSVLQRSERVDDGDEVLDGHSAVAPAFEPTDVALIGTQRACDLLLRPSMRASEDPELLSQRGNGLASRLLAASHMLHRPALEISVNLQELAPVDETSYSTVGSFLGRGSRILAIATDGHLSLSSASTLAPPAREVRGDGPNGRPVLLPPPDH